jgi:rhodanese-related sulfurtransferase
MWIMTKKPDLRVLDVRPQQQFAAGHVPGSRLFTQSLLDRNATIVIVTGGVIPRDIRLSKDMYVLEGGYPAWHDEVLAPARPTPLTKYFGGVRRGGC